MLAFGGRGNRLVPFLVFEFREGNLRRPSVGDFGGVGRPARARGLFGRVGRPASSAGKPVPNGYNRHARNFLRVFAGFPQRCGRGWERAIPANVGYFFSSVGIYSLNYSMGLRALAVCRGEARKALTRICA